MSASVTGRRHPAAFVGCGFADPAPPGERLRSGERESSAERGKRSHPPQHAMPLPLEPRNHRPPDENRSRNLTNTPMSPLPIFRLSYAQ